MSEQAAGPTSGEQGSLNEGMSHSAATSSEPVNAPATETGDRGDVPVSEPAMPEPSLSEPSLSGPVAADTPKAEAVRAAEASAQAPQAEAASDEISRTPGKVIVMSRENRAWTDKGIHSEPDAEEQQHVSGKRRIAAIAAVLALATMAGAIGGALATASLMHGTNDVAAAGSQTPALTASLSRIDSDIQALKLGLDRTSKLGLNQFNKTSERLDRLEHAQTEPAAKLARLSEAIDKLHALPVPVPAVAAASAAAKDVTGSIATASAQQQAAAASTAPKNDLKAELGRLPTLDDWVLRDVAYGGALIDGRRRGLYEVYAGDMVPGLGRIDAVRRQDGRWVVVTSRGLIVAR
jgi:hypothetical protein